MNFMGIGLAELAVIFLVAFLVLGPNRSIGMARSAGKVLADLRRAFSDVAAAASLEETERPSARPESSPPGQQEFDPADPPATLPANQEESSPQDPTEPPPGAGDE